MTFWTIYFIQSVDLSFTFLSQNECKPLIIKAQERTCPMYLPGLFVILQLIGSTNLKFDETFLV